jgi:hypothetical protein
MSIESLVFCLGGVAAVFFVAGWGVRTAIARARGECWVQHHSGGRAEVASGRNEAIRFTFVGQCKGGCRRRFPLDELQNGYCLACWINRGEAKGGDES